MFFKQITEKCFIVFHHTWKQSHQGASLPHEHQSMEKHVIMNAFKMLSYEKKDTFIKLIGDLRSCFLLAFIIMRCFALMCFLIFVYYKTQSSRNHLCKVIKHWHMLQLLTPTLIKSVAILQSFKYVETIKQNSFTKTSLKILGCCVKCK